MTSHFVINDDEVRNFKMMLSHKEVNYCKTSQKEIISLSGRKSTARQHNDPGVPSLVGSSDVYLGFSHSTLEPTLKSVDIKSENVLVLLILADTRYHILLFFK